jgi:hypothetical protein
MVMAARHASITPYIPQTLDLPSIGTFVSFYHVCLGFPVKQTWLDAIKAGNCDTFDGLTYSNMARYCPDSNETILEHLAQQRQNVRSTKPKCPTPSSPTTLPTAAPGPKDMPSNQVFIKVYLLSRLYTNNTVGAVLIKKYSSYRTNQKNPPRVFSICFLPTKYSNKSVR